VPEAKPADAIPPTASGHVSWASATTDGEEDDCEELAPQTLPGAPISPTVSAASAPVSWASASADDEEDDGEELAPQMPPAAPCPTAPSAVTLPASWTKVVAEDEAELAPFTQLAASMTCVVADADEKEDADMEMTSPSADALAAAALASRRSDPAIRGRILVKRSRTATKTAPAPSSATTPALSPAAAPVAGISSVKVSSPPGPLSEASSLQPPPVLLPVPVAPVPSAVCCPAPSNGMDAESSDED
jgi:hypothetical protein